jgi:hypothetical protein
MEKVLASGPMGSVVLKEAAGVVSLVLASELALGGGSMEGAMKAKLSGELDLDAKILIDAGLELAAAKFPALAMEIMAAKALIDAEIAKA